MVGCLEFPVERVQDMAAEMFIQVLAGDREMTGLQGIIALAAMYVHSDVAFNVSGNWGFTIESSPSGDLLKARPLVCPLPYLSSKLSLLISRSSRTKHRSKFP
jgi:hypothetical protein